MTFGVANGICDRCGFEHPLDQLRREWTGLRVCNDCWEPRHPQEFVRGVPDRQAVPNPRPDPPPVYIDPNDVVFDDITILDHRGLAITDQAELRITE